MLQGKAPFIVHDWRQETRFRQPAMLESEGIVSSLHLPIFAQFDDRLVGVLRVHATKPRLFSEEELVFLDSVVVAVAHVMRAGRGEEAFHALVDGASDVVARFDTGLRFVFVNAAFEQLLGSPYEELVGKELRQTRVPETLLGAWEIVLRRAAQTGREQSTVFKVMTSDGEQTFQSRIVPGFDADGSIKFLLAISRDISEQRTAEAERAQLYREVVAQQQQLKDMVVGVIQSHERECARVNKIVQVQQLTRNDQIILRLVAKGWTNREIAAELGRSPGTVKNQVARILVKLDVSDRTQAAVRAWELGLVASSTE
jgi:PAS domain S-box-containing protein